MATVGTESITQVWDIIKDDFRDGVIEQIPREVVLFDKIKFENTDGREMVLKTELGGNLGIGFVAERGTLPIARGGLFDEWKVRPKYMYGRMELTGPQIHQCAGKAAAFIDLVAHKMENTKRNFVRVANRVMWGDASGRLAQIAGTPTYSSPQTTCVIDNGNTYDFLEHGWVTFGTDTTLYEIDEVDHANSTIYIIGDATSVAVNDAYVYHGGSYDSGLGFEPMGLKGHISASNPPQGSYQTLDRTGTGMGWTQAYVKNMASAAFTTSDIREFLWTIRGKTAGELPNIFLTEEGVFNSYLLLLEAKGQQMQPVVSNQGYAESVYITQAGKKLELMNTLNCPQGSIYAVNDKYMFGIESRKLDYDKTFRSQVFMPRENSDMFEGRIAWYWNVGVDWPKAHGVMTNIKRNDIT
jgi:hypothetical protein